MFNQYQRELFLAQILYAVHTKNVDEMADHLETLVGEFGRVCERRKVKANKKKKKQDYVDRERKACNIGKVSFDALDLLSHELMI